MIIIRIEVPDYLLDWCRFKWGDEKGHIRFPRGSNECEILERLLKKTPENPIEPDGNLPIEVPNFKSKPNKDFTWLTTKDRKMLVHALQVYFRIELWHDLFDIERLRLPIGDSVWTWMEEHGISDDPKNWEAIRQIFYRQRLKYRNKEQVNNA